MVEVSLYGNSTLWCICYSSQFCVSCKCAEVTHSAPQSILLMKMVNKTGPSVAPCGKSLLPGLQLDFLTNQHSLGHSDSFKSSSLTAYLSHCFSGFSLINSCWLLLMIFFSFACLAVVFRINCFMSSPRIKVRLTSLKFTRTSLLHFLKTGETFAFLQCFGISPTCINQRVLRVASQWHLLAQMSSSGLTHRLMGLMGLIDFVQFA